MRYLFYYLIIFITPLFILSCQSDASTVSLDKDSFDSPIADSLLLWLPVGDHIADVMNAYDESLTEIARKFAEGVRENQEWFFEYAKKLEPGEPMPYHPNLGLTEEEYDTYGKRADSLNVMSSAQERFIVIHNSNTISFRSSGKNIMGLNFFEIDLLKNVIRVGQPGEKFMELEYEKEINVQSNSNIFKSKWHGYKWSFNTLKEDPDFDNIKSIIDYPDFTNMTITIGKLDIDQRIWFQFSLKSMKNGVTVANNELPLLIK